MSNESLISVFNYFSSYADIERIFWIRIWILRQPITNKKVFLDPYSNMLKSIAVCFNLFVLKTKLSGIKGAIWIKSSKLD